MEIRKAEKLDDTVLSCWGKSNRDLFAYVRGKQGPNYPIPAIRYEWDWINDKLICLAPARNHPNWWNQVWPKTTF